MPMAWPSQANFTELARDRCHDHPDDAAMPIQPRLTDASAPRFASSAIRDLLDQARQPGVISLAGGLPAAELLPVERLDVALSGALDEYGAHCLQYGPSVGEPALLEALALTESHDVDGLIVTAGSQQALDLTLSILEHDDPLQNLAAVENPGYVGALQVLRARRYRLLSIPVDADGMAVDELAAALVSGARPQVCYVNPSFQNPTGASLTPERGSELIRLAEHYGFVVISDDPYAELHLDGPKRNPIPDSDRLVRLGSMSKTLSPGLRIGWAAAPPPIRSRLELAKQAGDLHTATLNQLAVASILGDQRWWTDHCHGLRTSYRSRRTALLAALERALGSDPQAKGITIGDQAGGFFLWLSLESQGSEGTGGTEPDSIEIARAALDNGVAVVPGSAFAADPAAPPRAVRLSYSSAAVADFDLAVIRLASHLTA